MLNIVSLGCKCKSVTPDFLDRRKAAPTQIVLGRVTQSSQEEYDKPKGRFCVQ